MPMILALIILLTMLLLTLMWSTIRKQENVIRELSTRESWLEREVERLRTDNEKLYRWLRYNGEKVIDEMTCELDALSAVRQTNRDSYRRQLYLFDCLSLMVWAGMEGAEDSTREKVRKAFGIGAIPGFLALMLHTVGSLTKLFYEAVESAQNKPVRGLAACGASPLQKIRFALWPQVKPLFLSYGFMRLEINFRSSTILGLVGAGGIGQELMTNIKLDRYDQVSITLLLIILVVSALDMLSGRLRLWVLEGKK